MIGYFGVASIPLNRLATIYKFIVGNDGCMIYFQ